jgi:hypothetical protein
MHDPKTNNPVVDEQAWQAWLERGRRRNRATAQKAKLLACVALTVLLLSAAGVFLFSPK